MKSCGKCPWSCPGPLEWQNIDAGREINCLGVAVLLGITIPGLLALSSVRKLNTSSGSIFYIQQAWYLVFTLRFLLWRYDCVGGRQFILMRARSCVEFSLFSSLVQVLFNTSCQLFFWLSTRDCFSIHRISVCKCMCRDTTVLASAESGFSS